MLKAAFDNVSTPIVISRRRDGVIVTVNDAWVRATGVARERAVGRTGAAIGHWTDPALRNRIVALADAEGRADDVLAHFVRPDGRRRSVLASCVRVEFGGEPYLLWSSRDVTEIQQAAERERQLHRKYAAVFATSPGAVAISRQRDGVHLEVNDAWERLTGMRREAAVGRPALQLGMWQNPADRAGAIGRLDADGAVFNFPTRFVRADGRAFDVLLSGAKVELEGEPCVVWCWADVSEMRRAEAQVRELNLSLERRVAERTAELEAANKELESFSYSVSHDLRAPLRAIAGFAGILREDHGAVLTGEVLRLFGRIEQNATRMGELIDDLLELSRAGRVALERSAVDMAGLVEAMLRELRHEAADRHDIRVGELPPVTGDASLLRLVWQNLIGNALKFSVRVAAPRIEIGSVRGGGRVEYFVRDNGAGFDMRYANKLFGVFQRLHAPSEFEGTGVGLAIVQRIVLRHGGEVRAEGEPSRGATFRFSLPAA